MTEAIFRQYIVTLDDDSVLHQQIAEGAIVERDVFRNPGLEGRQVVSITEIDGSVLGRLDRTFRNAWRFCPNNGVRICMDAARDVHRDALRARRQERFGDLRVAVERSMLEGRDVTASNPWAQALRDVTADPAIDAARTPEELKAVWPSALEARTPELGAPRLVSEAGSYDTKAIETWANGLTDTIAQLSQKVADVESKSGGVEPKDIQILAQAVKALSDETTAMKAGLKKAQDDATYALERGLSDVGLTKETMQ